MTTPDSSAPLSAEVIEGMRLLTLKLRSSPMQDIKQTVLDLIASHESLRTALASARAALEKEQWAHHTTKGRLLEQDAEIERASELLTAALPDTTHERLSDHVADVCAALDAKNREIEGWQRVLPGYVDRIVELTAALSEATRREEALQAELEIERRKDHAHNSWTNGYEAAIQDYVAGRTAQWPARAALACGNNRPASAPRPTTEDDNG